MTEPTLWQIRNFRLRAHHLDKAYTRGDLSALVGGCGMQNSPPGVWEAALYNRAPSIPLPEMEQMLCRDKTLLQAWSFRGAPVVFPVEESGVFLSALLPQGDEPWIYTAGIGLALDFLQMNFDQLLALLYGVMPRLEGLLITSKTTLDQTLAEWMTPLLPEEKRDLWNAPSMYGDRGGQTVGGAVVSFLLRPCAFGGQVVFGERGSGGPTFTSYQSWMGQPFTPDPEAVPKLVRKYLHCYGPATANRFAAWLGCSGGQARRMWAAVADELTPVMFEGKKAYLLTEDMAGLFSPEPLQQELLLLGCRDPYLDQRDRLVLQPNKAVHKQIWTMVTNPGAIVYRGEIIGLWTAKTTLKGLDMKMNLWTAPPEPGELWRLAEGYAAFRQTVLL